MSKKEIKIDENGKFPIEQVVITVGVGITMMGIKVEISHNDDLVEGPKWMGFGECGFHQLSKSGELKRSDLVMCVMRSLEDHLKKLRNMNQ